MRNVGLDEAQAGIKIARRNINNLRHQSNGRKWRRTKDLLDESKRGEWKSWLKAQHSEKQRSWHPVPSVQFSLWVMSDSLRPHEVQLARTPCPSPTPRIHPNPCPLCRWCHPAISSSVVPFSSCPQSFPASGSFQMSQLFASGGQSFGVSAPTSVPPMNTQDWSPLGWTGWISLQSKGLSRVFSNTTV